jgi:hypothetical protein
MQDLSQVNPVRGAFAIPSTIILDGLTGTAAGIPVDPDVAGLLAAAGLGVGPPARTQEGGTNTTPGSLASNDGHYHWLADAATKVVLPRFVATGKPFVLVFWSGDPDQTQHAQGDSLNSLTPGINGPTSRAAVRNADSVLKQLLDYVNSDQALRDNTDVFVTADHGFSTVSRRAVDAGGRATTSHSASFVYRDATGRQDVNTGSLPAGYFAIDLAHALGLPMFAPDLQVADGSGAVYGRIDPAIPQQTATIRQRPVAGVLIGGTGRVMSPDAKIIVAGHSLYVPDRDPAIVRKIVEFLATQDYIGALFVDDSFGKIPGALPMSAIGLRGATALPSPAVIIGPRAFVLDPADPSMTAVIVEGGAYQQGHGDHAAFVRANTFNNMAAIGPDFKKRYVDEAPVGNVDIAPTLAKIMGITLPRNGALGGRILAEALIGGPRGVASRRRIERSGAAGSGKATILMYQQVGRQRYYDQVCFTEDTCQ